MFIIDFFLYICYILILKQNNKMKKLGNNDIIEIANVKLINGYSESRVCDWVFQMCDNDKRALMLLKYILDADEVKIGY